MAVRSLGTYNLNIETPQDVSVPVTIPAVRYATAEEIRSVADLCPYGWMNPRRISPTVTYPPESWMLDLSYNMPNNAIYCKFYGQFISSGGIGGLSLEVCIFWPGSLNFPLKSNDLCGE